MNAPAVKTAPEMIELAIGAAVVKVPGEAAALAYLEQVIDERRPLSVTLMGTAERLEELRRIPKVHVGEKGLYGTYAGIARADEQDGDHILEVIAVNNEAMPWEAAKTWAESVRGVLPTRKHAALLFANVPELFESEWYWTSEQHAEGGEYAWMQLFGYGGQYFSHKSNSFRAVAVRRVPL